MESGDAGKIPIFEKLKSFLLRGSKISCIETLKPNTDRIHKSFDFSWPSQNHVNIQEVILQCCFVLSFHWLCITAKINNK